MYAFEFLAHDYAGMTLSGVTDGGLCLWDGSDEQRANAEAIKIAYAETKQWLKIEEDDAPYEN